MFHTNKALYADVDGNLVPEGDESAHVMVAAANSDVDDQTVALYGLKGDGDKADDANTFHDNTMSPMELKSLQNTARKNAEARAQQDEAAKRLLAAKPAGAPKAAAPAVSGEKK